MHHHHKVLLSLFLHCQHLCVAMGTGSLRLRQGNEMGGLSSPRNFKNIKNDRVAMATCVSSHQSKILLIKKFEIKMFTSDWFFFAERRGWVAQQSVTGINSESSKTYETLNFVSGLLLMAFKIFVMFTIHIYYGAHHMGLKVMSIAICFE